MKLLRMAKRLRFAVDVLHAIKVERKRIETAQYLGSTYAETYHRGVLDALLMIERELNGLEDQ